MMCVGAVRGRGMMTLFLRDSSLPSSLPLTQDLAAPTSTRPRTSRCRLRAVASVTRPGRWQTWQLTMTAPHRNPVSCCPSRLPVSPEYVSVLINLSYTLCVAVVVQGWVQFQWSVTHCVSLWQYTVGFNCNGQLPCHEISITITLL